MTDFAAGNFLIDSLSDVILGLAPETKLGYLPHDIPPQDNPGSICYFNPPYQYFSTSFFKLHLPITAIPKLRSFDKATLADRN